jgi:hypothetical protein
MSAIDFLKAFLEAKKWAGEQRDLRS